MWKSRTLFRAAATGLALGALAFTSPSAGHAAGLELRQQAGGNLENGGLVVGDRLYIPTGSSLSTWTLPSTGAPQPESISDTVPGTIAGVAALDGSLYVSWRGSDLLGGLTRFSLADPSRPRRAEDLPYSTAEFRQPGALAVVGGLLYLADFEAGLFVIDPADPGNAQRIFDFFQAQRMVLDGTRLTVWSQTFLGFLVGQVLDVSDPAQPVNAGTFDAGQMLRGALESTLFAAVGPEGLRLLDLTDPAQPVQRFHDPTVAADIPLAVHLSGNALYYGSADGIHVWDVTNPALAAEVAVLPAPSLRTVSALFLDLGGQPSGLFLTEMGRGLRLDLGSPLAPTLDATWNLPVGSAPTTVATRGDTAFVADTYSGLRVLDANDIERNIGRLDGPAPRNSFNDLAVSEDLAVFTNWLSGLMIADIRDPAAPVWLGQLDLIFPSAVDVDGTLAAVVSSTNGGFLFMVDIADPANPSLLGFEVIEQGIDVAFHRGKVLVADEAGGIFGGLRIFDIANPASPQQIGHYTDCELLLGMAVQGDFAYLLCGQDTLDVVDISVPSSPVRVGRYVDPVPFRNGRGIALSGDRLLATFGSSIKSFALAGAGDPVLLETLPLDAYTRTMTVDPSGRLWVASLLHGVLQFQVDGVVFSDGFESGNLSAWRVVVDP